jgi:hypothetical protein
MHGEVKLKVAVEAGLALLVAPWDGSPGFPRHPEW